MRLFSRPARERALIEEAIAREIRAVEWGIVPDTLLGPSAPDDGHVLIAVIEPNDSVFDVVRQIMAAYRKPKANPQRRTA